MICKTMEGWGYDEVLRMPEWERVWWYERCLKHHREMKEMYDKAEAKARQGARKR